MEPDLSASITRHPHLFRLASSPPSRASSRPSSARPPADGEEDRGHVDHPADVASHAAGNSTGVEYRADNDAAAAAAATTTAVERHHASAPCLRVVTDVEGQTAAGAGSGGRRRLPRLSAENDPYGLSLAYKTDLELAQIQSASTGADGADGMDGADGADDGTGPAGGTRRRAVEAPRMGDIRLERLDRRPADGGGGDAGGGRATTGKPATPSALLARCLPAGLRALLGGGARQTRRVQGFYRTQNATIERLLTSVEEHRAAARQEQGDDQLRVRVAVYGSFAANVVLAVLQVYGAVSSGSLSLFTTMADAVFDPLSNVTLILTNRAVRRVDPARFPSGKARLETVGNIGFCFLMTAVSWILIAFSVRALAPGGRGPADDGDAAATTTTRFHLPSVVAVAVAFATKLALFLYTAALRRRYSQVQILWQDHRNDLLINGFGLLTSVGGSKLVWWIDPAGAVVLGALVSALWLRTAFAEFLLLVGVVASVDTQRLITYVCVTHSPAVQQIDTVRVYHAGPRLIAEVDVVMPPRATLAETHDIAEALQFKLECLPDVERAYVHVDYETTHKPEHAYKKDL